MAASKVGARNAAAASRTAGVEASSLAFESEAQVPWRDRLSRALEYAAGLGHAREVDGREVDVEDVGEDVAHDAAREGLVVDEEADLARLVGVDGGLREHA